MSINTENKSIYVRTDLEQAYQDSPLHHKVKNFLTMIFHASYFYASMIPRISLFSDPRCLYAGQEKKQWKENNQGLFVLVHGLLGNPTFSCMSYLEQIEKDHPGKYEIIAPYVPKKGNCSLEEAAEPILQVVKDYIQHNPGKPINLIGTSNGGRIIAYIETSLRNENLAIRVTGIAGAFFGSKSMDTLAQYKIAPLLFHHEIIEDLQEGSLKAKDLVVKMQEPITQGKRAYTFYASVNDFYIPNFSGSFPVIKGAEYCLKAGEDHVSLGKSVQTEELTKAYKWMEENQNNT